MLSSLITSFSFRISRSWKKWAECNAICRDFSEYFEEDVQVYILRLQVTTVTCLIAVIQCNCSVFACFWDRQLLHLVLPSVDVLWPLTLDEIRRVASTQRFVSHKFSQLLRYDWNAPSPDTNCTRKNSASLQRHEMNWIKYWITKNNEHQKIIQQQSSMIHKFLHTWNITRLTLDVQKKSNRYNLPGRPRSHLNVEVPAELTDSRINGIAPQTSWHDV